MMSRAGILQATTVVIALVALATAARFSLTLDTFVVPSGAVTKSDVDLSGAWSIRLADDPGFARPALDDSTWCLINVPHETTPVSAVPVGARPDAGCPDARHLIQNMVGATYWFRRHITIAPGQGWGSPSLFIGAIKHEGTFYWDGELIGRATKDDLALAFSLTREQTRPGAHLLAVRMTSHRSTSPGISHSYSRGVALGEWRATQNATFEESWIRYVEPFAGFFVQFSALLLLLFFTARVREPRERLVWLSVNLGCSGVLSSIHTPTAALYDLFFVLNILTDLSLAGYGAQLFLSSESQRRAASLLIIGLAVAGSGAQLWINHDGTLQGLLGAAPRVARSFVTLALLAGMLIAELMSRRDSGAARQPSMALFSFALIGGMVSLQAFAELSHRFTHVPLLRPVFALVVLAIAIEDSLETERQLGFFGGYIRPGLKALLARHSERLLSGEKLLVGRKVALLKVDIIGFTDTTFGMPYGLRRLFQDMWFSEVDRLVVDLCLMDKPEGDGSFYYFSDELSPTVATLAFGTALRIRDEAVRRFDEDFGKAARELIAREPGLEPAAARFLEAYKERTGVGFFERRTAVRFALLYGYVDEGLWGMISRGHYGLLGDLMTLAARLEKLAPEGGIVMCSAFQRKLAAEGFELAETYEVTRERASLKGIGVYEYVTARPRP